MSNDTQKRPKRFKDISRISEDGKLRLNLHRGQAKAWKSDARFVCVLAGTQGGKTSFGPYWLWREIKRCGPGDYMVVTPTFTLLEKKALPEFLKFFKKRLQLGDYVGGSKKTFTVSEAGKERLFGEDYQDKYHDTETKIFFGHAQDPESLESATAKAAWLDEVGQKKFKLGSWEAIQRRLSIHQGRALFTTTPYNLGWLKQEIWDKRKTDPDIEVIRFESKDNPIFPIEEWYRAKATLPGWKFNLFYRAIFTKPAGLIYDSFDEDSCKIPRFNIPDEWPRYWGFDFGGVNTVCLFYANEPGTQKYYLYRAYKSGNKSAKAHARAITAKEPKLPDDCRGGAPSEDQWRREFRDAGIPIKKPRVKDVEVGINRVHGAHKQNKIIVFDDLDHYLDEKMTYSRKLDDNDEPTEEIEDKNKFHHMDAERYIIGSLMTDKKGSTKKSYSKSYTTP
ncbi:hypothetical protein [Fodinibius sp.]|uniref:hypothetical protein n=1 Tax=Fodinibius sp. TaxID=1872440 RepID=UPI002ACE9CA9|nr:hypothetical protein [Fodinibius sp.]MDZ7658067.1 hypothetical protein [Fodinibius sp.]